MLHLTHLSLTHMYTHIPLLKLQLDEFYLNFELSIELPIQIVLVGTQHS